MARPQQALGRPGTPVIPAGWAAAHGAVVAKTWTVPCEIRHPGGTKGTFDTATGTYPLVPHDPHFTGTARVQVLSIEESARLVADQELTTAGYRVVVALSATEVEVDDVVTLTAVPTDGDETLIDRELTVRAVTRGSLAWERDLIAIDNLS